MPIGQARKFVWHLHGSMWTLSSSWDRAWQHSICFSCLLFLFFSSICFSCFFFSFLLILVCFFFSCFSCLVLFCYSMYYRRQNVERETGASVKRCNAAGVPAERDPAEREAFKLKVLSAMTFKPEGSSRSSPAEPQPSPRPRQGSVLGPGYVLNAFTNLVKVALLWAMTLHACVIC